MIFACPGSNRFRQPSVEMVSCPLCGGDAEVWSDEAFVLCPKCGKTAYDGGQSCIDWCAHARECVGLERYGRHATGRKIGGL